MWVLAHNEIFPGFKLIYLVQNLIFVSESLVVRKFQLLVMIIISIIAPRMTGILVKIFTWFLESPILGPLLLYILKGNNLINKVSSWSMLSSFHFREILFQLNRISSCVLLVTLLLLNDWRNQQCGYHLNSNFLFPIHGQFLFLQLITNADLEESPLYVPSHHFEGLLFSTRFFPSGTKVGDQLHDGVNMNIILIAVILIHKSH